MPIFRFKPEKNLHRPEKFTLTASVASVTIMRYVIIKMMIIMMIIFFKSRHVRTTIENSNQYVFVTTTLHNNFDDIDNESAERVGRTSSWKCLQLSLQHSLGEVAILAPATPPSLPLSPSSPSPPVAQSSSPSSLPPPSGPFLVCNHQGYQDQNISQDQD